MAHQMAQVTAQRMVQGIAQVTAHRTDPVAAGTQATTHQNVRRADEALRAMKDE